MAADQSGESVLSRATRILEAFDFEGKRLSVSAISRRTGIPMASAHRLVSEMVRLGLLERDPDKLVRVGVRVWELGWRSTAALDLREMAMPYMEDLHAVVKQHTQLAVLEGMEVLYIERMSARGDTAVNITRVASRLPAHATSSGLVLLAFGSTELQEEVLAAPLRKRTPTTVTDPHELRRLFAEARQKGYATARGTVHQEAAGVAAPIRDRDMEVVAAISVIIPNSASQVAAAVPAVLASARGVTRALQRTPVWGRNPGR